MWNWALDEWNRQYAAGQKPHASALKKQFNTLKYQQFPWLHDVHRDAHAQPFADLADAWQRFFTGQNDCPVFKKKGKTPDSFYVANDKFQIAERRVKLPKIGWVCLRESLRFPGKILGARVVREGDQWFFAVPVSVPDAIYYRPRAGHGIEGVDVGVKTFATTVHGREDYWTSSPSAGFAAPENAATEHHPKNAGHQSPDWFSSARSAPERHAVAAQSELGQS